MTETSASPLSFAVSVRRLPRKGMPVHIEANDKQRAALASEHGLKAVDRFVANLTIWPWKGEGVRVEGRVRSAIVQACVVSLDPVPAVIDEEVEAVFVPEGSRLARPRNAIEGEILLDPDGPDAPETFSGDTIDVGALAEEFFGLGIDPYPRAAGASAGTVSTDHEAEPSPFAKLLALKRRE